jgi:uncharacterized membrane protein
MKFIFLSLEQMLHTVFGIFGRDLLNEYPLWLVLRLFFKKIFLYIYIFPDEPNCAGLER